MPWHVVGDWGTTRLRLYRLEDGIVTDRCEGPGIGVLTEAPVQVLRSLLSRWSTDEGPTSVTLCGMAGSRTGLCEAPYVACPAGVERWRQAVPRFILDDLSIRIAPGVRMGNRDVMRGEETQIFGALARHAELGEGSLIVVLPGTHSKWVRVEDGIISDFRTFFTGEFYGLLVDHSTLLKVAADRGGDGERDTGWFDGLMRARAGAGLLGAVFESRAAQLLADRTAGWARGYLSGLLVGAEIEEGRRWSGELEKLLLIGVPDLAEYYRRAFDYHGIGLQREDGEGCVLAGLELLNADD